MSGARCAHPALPLSATFHAGMMRLIIRDEVVIGSEAGIVNSRCDLHDFVTASISAFQDPRASSYCPLGSSSRRICASGSPPLISILFCAGRIVVDDRLIGDEIEESLGLNHDTVGHPEDPYELICIWRPRRRGGRPVKTDDDRVSDGPDLMNLGNYRGRETAKERA